MNNADRLGPEHEALIVATLAKRVKGRLDLLRAIIGTAYSDGEKNTFRSPLDGQKLGSVWRTDPDPEWRVVDPLSLNAWLEEQADYLQESVRVRDDCWPEALACLATHNPDVLEQVVRVREGAVNEVLAECARQKRAVAPGIELVKPEGSVTIRPAPTAGEAIRALVEARVIDWDGRPALDPGDAA
jgi:hypothetical protein